MKKKYLFVLILILLLITLDFIKVDKPVSYNILTEQQAHDLFPTLEKGSYIILDVRTKSEYDDYHIANAINLPLDQIEENADKVLPDKDKAIYVYCRSGNRSVTASKLLVKLGYTHITEFGGIIDYPQD